MSKIWYHSLTTFKHRFSVMNPVMFKKWIEKLLKKHLKNLKNILTTWGRVVIWRGLLLKGGRGNLFSMNNNIQLSGITISFKWLNHHALVKLQRFIEAYLQNEKSIVLGFFLFWTMDMNYYYFKVQKFGGALRLDNELERVCTSRLL